jgi:hypothetical protein
MLQRCDSPASAQDVVLDLEGGTPLLGLAVLMMIPYQ